MPPRRALRIVAVLAFAGSLLGASAPGPALAATPRAVLPEPGPGIVRHSAVDAAVADLDGDGRPELAVIAPWSIDQSRLAVALFEVSSTGEVAFLGETAIRRRVSVEEELVGAVRPDRDGMTRLTVDDAARFVPIERAGRRHLVVVVNAGGSFGEQAPCCLTAWEVVPPSRAGDGPDLRKVVDTQRGGDAVVATDLDGTGTDELVVNEPAGPDPAALTLLQWRGDGFSQRTTLQPSPVGDGSRMFQLGDTDGLPGSEVAFVSGDPQNPLDPAIHLTRLSLRQGRIHLETVTDPDGGVPLTLPASKGSPAAIALGTTRTLLGTYRWPADGALTPITAGTFTGQPVAVVGAGTTVRLLVLQRYPTTSRLQLVAPTLERDTIAEIDPGPATLPFAGSTRPPYVGPWPTDDAAGTEAAAPSRYVFAGNLIVQDGAQVTARPVAALPGTIPIGFLGGGQWVALLQLRSDAGAGDRLGPGLVAGSPAYGVSVVARSSVESAEPQHGGLDLPAAGLRPDPNQGGAAMLAALGTSIRVTIDAPVGTQVAVAVGEKDWLSQETIDSAPGLVSIPPPKGTAAADVRLRLTTPGGHGYLAGWTVRRLAAHPPLTATPPAISLGLDASITGTTDPAAVITVAGRTARPDSNGRFEVAVPGGLLPSDVRVLATDPFGRTTAVVVSVVVPIDYRQLPWIPIVVALTVLVAVGLFLRAPAAGHKPAPSADEGTFEELEIEER